MNLTQLLNYWISYQKKKITNRRAIIIPNIDSYLIPLIGNNYYNDMPWIIERMNLDSINIVNPNLSHEICNNLDIPLLSSVIIEEIDQDINICSREKLDDLQNSIQTKFSDINFCNALSLVILHSYEYDSQLLDGYIVQSILEDYKITFVLELRTRIIFKTKKKIN